MPNNAETPNSIAARDDFIGTVDQHVMQKLALPALTDVSLTSDSATNTLGGGQPSQRIR